MRRTLELTVAELDCADEAQQIEGALHRLDGVAEVRTAVSARRALVAYDAARVTPEAIRETVRALGMTVSEVTAPPARRRRSLPDRFGWAFVSVVAAVALVGIAASGSGSSRRSSSGSRRGSRWPPCWPAATRSSSMSCARSGIAPSPPTPS